MARRAGAYSSSSDDSRLLSSDASDSDDHAPPKRSRTTSTTARLSPLVWVSIAVLIVAVWVLLAVVVWQQTGGSASKGDGAGAAVTTAATSGAVSAAPTTRGGQGGQGSEDEASPSRSSSQDDADASSPTRSPSASPPSDNDEDAPKSKISPSPPSSPSSTPSSGSLPALYGEQLNIDFSAFSSSDTVKGFLKAAGLAISNWPVGFEPISVMMTPDNVDIVDGALSLKVTGQSGKGEVQSAEVATVEQGILYGKVTTRAKASPVPGVWCVQLSPSLAAAADAALTPSFSLALDTATASSSTTRTTARSTSSSSRATTRKAEATRSSPVRRRSPRASSLRPLELALTSHFALAGIQYTNHPLTPDGEMYNEVYPYPFDPTADFHDVRTLLSSLPLPSPPSSASSIPSLCSRLTLCMSPLADASTPPAVHRRVDLERDHLLARRRGPRHLHRQRPQEAHDVQLELVRPLSLLSHSSPPRLISLERARTPARSWSSGEPNWSAGPPTEDSYLLISAIAANWKT